MKTLTFFLIATICLGGCTMHDKKSEPANPQGSDTETSRAVAGDAETMAAQPEPDKNKSTVASVKIGMKDEKVKALLGKPSKIEVVNPELGARIEDWWYGSNQMIRITGGQVTGIVRDVKQEQEQLLKIREAREKGDEAEAQRLTDEMKAGN